MVSIAVLGYGTIGSGVVEVLNTNADSINKKAGEEIQVKYVLDLRDFPGDPVQEKLVHDFNIILNDEEVRIVVEVMGGVEPAYTFVKKSLEAGKSVCTSNKELVAKHGPELLALAREKNINFLFEASVGGGIPIIRSLNSSMTADEIHEITGILNGTTNYILSKMADEGWEFGEALKKAQELGYAERNPDADINGYDSSRKIAILSSLAFGNHVDFEDIYTEGIAKITARDIVYANKLGFAIKLLASSKREGDNFYALVAPFMISRSHPLFSVNNVFNGIFVNGNVIGDTMFYGSGAGKLPTASAVMADVVDATRHLHRNVMSFWSSKKLELTSIEHAERRFFVRVKGTKEECLKKCEETFGPLDVITLEDNQEEFAFVTGVMSEKAYKIAAEKLDNMIGMIRIV